MGSRYSEEAETGDVFARLAAAIARSKKLAERAEALCVTIGDQVEAAWDLQYRLAQSRRHRAPAWPLPFTGCGPASSGTGMPAASGRRADGEAAVLIPDTEADRLAETAWAAGAAAAAGRLTEGFDLLLAGLHRAEELLTEGAAYGALLVAGWWEAAQNYCDRYGVPLA